MKTIKPLRLGILTRPFENARQYYLSVAVMAFFPFDTPERLLPEISLWKLVAKELGEEGILDEGMPKSAAEVLVAGHAFPPNPPKPHCHVRLRMRSIDRTLYVFGDRQWTLGGPTDPEPFTSMPITWSRAFGGEGFDKNPHGKGIKPIKSEQKEWHPLPNVENPQKLIRSTRDKPDPAGFSPFDVTFSQRAGKAGTYDDRWLKEQYPGFPLDFDWTFFNVAPEEQRFEDFLRGGEEFTIDNMHPSIAISKGRLPRGRARCFAEVRVGESLEFREISTQIDTVWLFPGHSRGVVIHRGVLPVTEDDAADVVNLLAAYEAEGQPKSIEHYKRALADRLDKKSALTAVLRDRDLLPEMPPAGNHPDEEVSDMKELLTTDRLVLENARRATQKRLDDARAEIKENFEKHPELAGQQPDLSGIPEKAPPLPPAQTNLDDLPDIVEGALKQAEEAQKKAAEESKQMEERARALCKEQKLDYDKLVADTKMQERKASRRFSAKAKLEHMEELVKLADNAEIDASEVRAALADPKLVEKLVALEEQLNDVYRKTAHYLEPTLADGEGITRTEVEQGARAGQTFAGRDFTNADLSGLNLTGIDLEGAFLEGANLSGTNLSNANLKHAVLAHANLSDAKLVSADLSHANAGGANFTKAEFKNAILHKTVLAKADLSWAQLSGANLDATDVSEAKFFKTDLSGATARNLLLVRTNLEDTNLRRADLTKTVFFEGSLKSVDFTEAICVGTVFMTVDGAGALFDRANMRSVRFVKDASFPNASFLGADMEGANLRSTVLTGAQFMGANLRSADLSEAQLEGANLSNVVANDAMFIRTDLRRANLENADLMQAILQKARVDGANFQGANLFRADMLRVRGDKDTRLRGAFVKRVRSIPERGGNA
ncbi:MAG: DUF2169 domain-containing protein [Polyangiaceae bacterium]|nr:DUF2169 domain-containing protein [Polyangiaceae bacterium]